MTPQLNVSTQRQDYRALLNQLSESHVFVVGDLVLDCYIEGKVQRISPEAPVPVVLESRQRAVIGGAGNVAANITAFGGQSYLCGRIGKDAEGATFKKLCEELSINC